jgi:hypothetical protein
MTPEKKLDCARALVALLRALDGSDRTMRYNEAAPAIGLIPPEGIFTRGHATQMADILNLAAVADSKVGKTTLPYHRIVGAGGKPGAGFHKVRQLKAA